MATAILEQDVGVAKQLVDKIDLKEKGKYGKTFLHMAVSFKTSKEIWELLIRAFDKKKILLDMIDIVDNYNKQTALDYALMSGNVLAIEFLIKAGADFQHQMPELGMTYLDYFFEKYANQPELTKKVQSIIQEQQKAAQGFLSTCLNILPMNFLYKGYEKVKATEEEQPEQPIKDSHTVHEKLTLNGKEKKE